MIQTVCYLFQPLISEVSLCFWNNDVLPLAMSNILSPQHKLHPVKEWSISGFSYEHAV